MLRRILKIIGWAIGALVLLVGLAGVAAYTLVTSDYVRTKIESHASAVSGRATKISGISIDWGWTSRVHLEDVEVSNADWGKADHMFKAEQIDFDIRLWPLLHGDFVLPRLILRKPEIYLERNAQDQSNWSSEQSPLVTDAARQIEPEHRHQTPLIGSLEIIDGRIDYMDAKHQFDLKGAVQTATGNAGAGPQAQLSLQGKLEGQPLNLHFSGGSALMLRETDKPYPVDLEVTYGETRLAVSGTIQDPIQYKGANVQLSLTGQDLSQIYPLLGIPGPPTPPYRITGKLTREPEIWHVVDMSWHTGSSDLSGDITVDQRSKPSQLTAHLMSQHLAFADLAPLIGVTPGKQSTTRQGLFPSAPLHVERLRAMNMDVALDAKKVVAPSYIPVQSLSAHVQVENGQATIRPLEMGFGGGKMTGNLSIDARPDDPVTSTNLQLQGIELAAFFRGSRYFDATDGKLRGRVALIGNGRSLAQIMDTANGDVVLTMAGGSVSALIVSLAGLQLGNALVLDITGDNRIPIRCALARLNFRRGAVIFDKTLVDTQKSVLHFDGQATLATQLLRSKITADTKQFDLLDLHAPVLIEGKIAAPTITVGRKIPVPTPDFGGAKDADCAELTREVWAAKP